MADFVTLTCPSCGGKLQITNDIERFACDQCGNEHIVKRSGGIISLTPVVDEIKKVVRNTDRAAIETTIMRINGEINALQSKSKELKKRIERSYNREIRNHFAARRGGLIGAFSILANSQDSNIVEIPELDDISIDDIDDMIASFSKSLVSFSFKQLISSLESIKELEKDIDLKQREVQNLKAQLR